MSRGTRLTEKDLSRLDRATGTKFNFVIVEALDLIYNFIFC